MKFILYQMADFNADAPRSIWQRLRRRFHLWFREYYSTPRDRRRTLKTILAGLVSMGLILTTAFLILYAFNP